MTDAPETPGPDENRDTLAVPPWAHLLIDSYQSGAASQFIVHGNVSDRMVVPVDGGSRLGSLTDFLLHALLPRFDVVLSYDLGNGIRVEKGGEVLSKWPNLSESQRNWKAPRPAIETLTHYFRFCANLKRINQPTAQVGCIIRNAELVAPATSSGVDYDLSAIASLIRDWANDTLLVEHALATFLIAENLNDLHPLIVNNPRVSRIKIDLPTADEMAGALRVIEPGYRNALSGFGDNLMPAVQQLVGASMSAVEGLLKRNEYRRRRLTPNDLGSLKKELIEADCNGLIEFVESRLTLNDLYGMEQVKEWLRQDVALWNANDIEGLPKGYLFCGPVGTGKTFMVQCLAGEASVPIVRLKNFRDKWVGSSEGNLEKIFRLLHALGRCYVFIDEADQAIGRRDGGSGDSGTSGRIYSMLAEEMGSSTNRGKIIWVLASSRPDLIETDLKRPGRVDIKIPLFPTATARESFHLISALMARRRMQLDEVQFAGLEAKLPLLLTPGAAEALAVKVYRLVHTKALTPESALQSCLEDYQNPIAPEVLSFQIKIAVQEATDLDFVPPQFRNHGS